MLPSVCHPQHDVIATVTVALCFPTDDNLPDVSRALRTRKRAIRAPRPQRFFRLAYNLLPDGNGPLTTDAVSYGIAAKIFIGEKNPKVRSSLRT